MKAKTDTKMFFQKNEFMGYVTIFILLRHLAGLHYYFSKGNNAFKKTLLAPEGLIRETRVCICSLLAARILARS